MIKNTINFNLLILAVGTIFFVHCSSAQKSERFSLENHAPSSSVNELKFLGNGEQIFSSDLDSKRVFDLQNNNKLFWSFWPFTEKYYSFYAGVETVVVSDDAKYVLINNGKTVSIESLAKEEAALEFNVGYYRMARFLKKREVLIACGELRSTKFEIWSRNGISWNKRDLFEDRFMGYRFPGKAWPIVKSFHPSFSYKNEDAFTKNYSHIVTMELSPTGKYLAYIIDSNGYFLRFFNLESGTQIDTALYLGNGNQSELLKTKIEFSSDEQHLAISIPENGVSGNGFAVQVYSVSDAIAGDTACPNFGDKAVHSHFDRPLYCEGKMKLSKKKSGDTNSYQGIVYYDIAAYKTGFLLVSQPQEAGEMAKIEFYDPKKNQLKDFLSNQFKIEKIATKGNKIAIADRESHEIFLYKDTTSLGSVEPKLTNPNCMQWYPDSSFSLGKKSIFGKQKSFEYYLDLKTLKVEYRNQTIPKCEEGTSILANNSKGLSYEWIFSDDMPLETEMDKYNLVKMPKAVTSIITADKKTLVRFAPPKDSWSGSMSFDVNKPSRKAENRFVSYSSFSIGSSDGRIDFDRMESESDIDRDQKRKSSSLIVIDAALSPDGKFLLVVGSDLLTRVFDISNPDVKLLCEIAIGANNNWMIATPEPYIVASSEALSSFGWKRKMVTQHGLSKQLRLHSFRDFAMNFIQPEKVLMSFPDHDQSLAKRYNSFWNYWIKRNGFNPSDFGNSVHTEGPEVHIKEKEKIPLKTQKQELDLKFNINGGNEKVFGYQVINNNIPDSGSHIKTTYPNTLKTLNDSVVTIETKLVLSQGVNKINIIGYDSNGVASIPDEIQINYNPPAKYKPELYFIGIGTDSYDISKTGGLDALKYAVKDSKELEETFKKSGASSFGKVHTKVLANAEVTRENVAKLKDFFKNSKVDDHVILFLSGHGIRKDTKVGDLITAFGENVPPQYKLRSKGDVDDVYYYMTSEANVEKPWEKAIPLDAIREIVNGIPSRQKIMLVDTCQSGEKLDLDDATVASLTKNIEIRKTRGKTASTRGVKLVTTPGTKEKPEEVEKHIVQTIAKTNALKEMSELFPELRRGTGTIEISAATGAQSALESGEWKNGAFTFVIKEAILKGKAKDGKGNITARSLRKYVLEEVEKLTDGQQTPMVARDIAGRDFVIFGK